MSEAFNEKRRFIRYKEGAKLYGLCQSTFEKRANEAGICLWVKEDVQNLIQLKTI